MDVGSRLQRVEEKVDKNGERLDRLEEKVDKNGERLDRLEEKVDKNGERLDRLEEKVDKNSAGIRANSAGIKANSAGIKANAEGIDRLIQGQEKQLNQSAEHFEFFKVYFEKQQEETRRHVEVLIEQFESRLSVQGEGIKANRESTQKVQKSVKQNREKLRNHETRIRDLEAG